MKITKLGHCCLLIEIEGLRVLTDPGSWNRIPDDIMDLDLILITHEHQDHLHIDSVKILLKNNPKAKLVTNPSVGKLLAEEGISFETLVHSQSESISGLTIEGFGEKHAAIYEGINPVENTGYYLGGKFFYPGDALYNLQKKVEVLALPVAGPWIKMAEVIDYAKAVHPKFAFPVHDGMLKEMGPFHFLPEKLLTPEGITFKAMLAGDVHQFDI